jgi:hypothetical protein
VAGARESFAFGVGDYAAQVRADGRDGMEALFLAEQKEAAGFHAGCRTDRELGRVAQLEDAQRTRLYGGFGQAHHTGKRRTHGDHHAP